MCARTNTHTHTHTRAHTHTHKHTHTHIHPGCEKAKFSWYKILMLSILAGAYVGFGYTTALQVGGLMDQAPSNPDKSEARRAAYSCPCNVSSYWSSYACLSS
jgi:hypothetical protein